MKKHYPSDLTEEQFNKFVFKYLPKVKEKRGRPKVYLDLDKFNGCLYVLKTGCQWRMIPSCYPPFRIVHKYFRYLCRWFKLDKVICNLNKLLEQQMNKHHEQPVKAPGLMLIVDSKSIRSSEYLERKSFGIDGNKKIKGIKLGACVDRLKRCWRVSGISGNKSEYHGIRRCVEATVTSKIKPEAKLVIADRYFDSDPLRKEFKNNFDLTLLALRRNRNKMRKFQLKEDQELENYRQEQLKKLINPFRWIVEQFFAHLEKARRLTMVWERKLNSYLGFVNLRIIQLIIQRIERLKA